MSNSGGHQETRGDSLLVVSIILLTIANVSSLSRLAIRTVKKQLGMDDYMSVLATVRDMSLKLRPLTYMSQITLDIQTVFVFCCE